MNYRQIEIFCAIMERDSITDAAQHLGLSQPAVSKSLKAMEDQLNIRLINRTTRGLHATDEARELYAEAQRVLQGFAQFETFARDLRKLEHARLIVAAMPALATTWLSRVVADFSSDYPEVSLVLRASGSANIVKSIAQGELDIGIGQVRLDDPSVSKRKLYDLQIMCALPRGHPLAEHPEITSAELHQQTLVLLSTHDEFRRMLEGLFVSKGVTIKSRIEVTLSVMVCSLVEEGRGIGIVDSQTAATGRWPGICFRPFKPTVKTPIYLLRNTRSPQSLASKRFSEYVIKNRLK